MTKFLEDIASRAYSQGAAVYPICKSVVQHYSGRFYQWVKDRDSYGMANKLMVTIGIVCAVIVAVAFLGFIKNKLAPFAMGAIVGFAGGSGLFDGSCALLYNFGKRQKAQATGAAANTAGSADGIANQTGTSQSKVLIQDGNSEDSDG